MADTGLRTAGRNAQVTRLVQDLLTTLSSVAETSSVVTWTDTFVRTFRHSWDTSAAESGTRHGLAFSCRVLRGSQVAGTVPRLSGPLDNALDRADVTDLAQWTKAAIRASWLYRWLTAEPEPEVIVIDLRETVSVGPAIAALDRLTRWLVPASHQSAVVRSVGAVRRSMAAAPVRAVSLVLGVAVLTNLAITLAVAEPTRVGMAVHAGLLGLAAIGTRVTVPWDELVETRVARLVIAALEPPEPPDDFER